MPAVLNACNSQEVQSMAAQCMERPALDFSEDNT